MCMCQVMKGDGELQTADLCASILGFAIKEIENKLFYLVI